MGKVIKFGPEENIETLEQALRECIKTLNELTAPATAASRGLNSMGGNTELVADIHETLAGAYRALSFSRDFDTKRQLKELMEGAKPR